MPGHARVRPTIHRFGKTSKALRSRFMISGGRGLFSRATGPPIPSVAADFLNEGKPPDKPLTRECRTAAILWAGPVNLYAQHHAGCIGHDMTLAPLDLFTRIETGPFPCIRPRFDRPAVHNGKASGRSRRFPHDPQDHGYRGTTHHEDEPGSHPGANRGSNDRPFAIGGYRGRKILRRHVPLTSRSRRIKIPSTIRRKSRSRGRPPAFSSGGRGKTRAHSLSVAALA